MATNTKNKPKMKPKTRSEADPPGTHPEGSDLGPTAIATAGHLGQGGGAIKTVGNGSAARRDDAARPEDLPSQQKTDGGASDHIAREHCVQDNSVAAVRDRSRTPAGGPEWEGQLRASGDDQEAAPSAFLDSVPRGYKDIVRRLFADAARGGAATPEGVLADARRALQKLLVRSETGPVFASALRTAIEALGLETASAAALAADELASARRTPA